MELMHLDLLALEMHPQIGQDLTEMEIAEIIKVNWDRDIRANKLKDHRAPNHQYHPQQ